MRYVAVAALVGCLGLCGALWWQSGTIDRLRAENATVSLSLGACDARLSNIQQDKESDDAINQIPDFDLRNVPDGWLLPPGAGGVY